MNIRKLLSAITLVGLASCQMNTSTQQKNTLANTLPMPTVSNQVQAGVELHTDFTDSTLKSGQVFDFFDVSVRTHKGSPNSIPATFGRTPKVNTVRMLGGWASQDVQGDTYKWDGEKYVYDFDQAVKRINNWLNNDWEIFQIVLDNPPWAFQRGYKFVEQADGVSYLKKDKVGVYGNGLPPNDPQAWHNYIQAFIKHLVDVYGEETVLQWRFRVGSEIDTRPQHWAATRHAFFDHYANTVSALKAVLPQAQVGAHFREASFKSQYVDYTGNKEDAYAAHFITWAKQHNVAYDFVAISYYPHIDKAHELDMQAVYQHDLAPIQQHPDWNPNASLEIHEYKLIIKMKRAGFVSVSTSHNSAFFAMFSKMLLEKNIKEVFQWGNQKAGNYNAEAMTQLALHSMVGDDLYRNNVIGAPQIAHNRIDGIFSKNPNKHQYSALIFNFNNQDLSYQAREPVKVKLTVKQPPNTSFEYRVGHISRETNIDQQFVSLFPKAAIPESEGGWLIENAHPTQSIFTAMNKQGQAVYQQQRPLLGKDNHLHWSDWQTSRTAKVAGAESVSNIEFNTQLDSFAVQQIQVRFAQ